MNPELTLNRSVEVPDGSPELSPPPGAFSRLPRSAQQLALERERLVQAAQWYAEASLAPTTRRKYRQALDDFALWCHDHAVPSLPASPETGCLYLSDLAVSTIQLRLAALKLAHRTAGHDQPGLPASPTEDIGVRQVIRGIRRTLGVAPRHQALPLLIQQLRVLLGRQP